MHTLQGRWSLSTVLTVCVCVCVCDPVLINYMGWCGASAGNSPQHKPPETAVAHINAQLLLSHTHTHTHTHTCSLYRTAFLLCLALEVQQKRGDVEQCAVITWGLRIIAAGVWRLIIEWTESQELWLYDRILSLSLSVCVCGFDCCIRPQTLIYGCRCF